MHTYTKVSQRNIPLALHAQSAYISIEAEVEAREENLTVVEGCPNCGGRISAVRLESGQLSATCIGVISDEIPCGWTTVDGSVTIIPIKRTA